MRRQLSPDGVDGLPVRASVGGRVTAGAPVSLRTSPVGGGVGVGDGVGVGVGVGMGVGVGVGVGGGVGVGVGVGAGVGVGVGSVEVDVWVEVVSVDVVSVEVDVWVEVVSVDVVSVDVSVVSVEVVSLELVLVVSLGPQKMMWLMPLSASLNVPDPSESAQTVWPNSAFSNRVFGHVADWSDPAFTTTSA